MPSTRTKPNEQTPKMAARAPQPIGGRACGSSGAKHGWTAAPTIKATRTYTHRLTIAPGANVERRSATVDESAPYPLRIMLGGGAVRSLRCGLRIVGQHRPQSSAHDARGA